MCSSQTLCIFIVDDNLLESPQRSGAVVNPTVTHYPFGWTLAFFAFNLS